MRVDIGLISLDSCIAIAGGAVIGATNGFSEVVGSCLAGGGIGGILGVLTSAIRNGDELPPARKMAIRAGANLLGAWGLGPFLGYYALTTDYEVIKLMPQFMVFFTSSVFCGVFVVAMLLTGEAWLNIKSKKLLDREQMDPTDPKRLP